MPAIGPAAEDSDILEAGDEEFLRCCCEEHSCSRSVHHRPAVTKVPLMTVIWKTRLRNLN